VFVIRVSTADITTLDLISSHASLYTAAR